MIYASAQVYNVFNSRPRQALLLEAPPRRSAALIVLETSNCSQSAEGEEYP